MFSFTESPQKVGKHLSKSTSYTNKMFELNDLWISYTLWVYLLVQVPIFKTLLLGFYANPYDLQRVPTVLCFPLGFLDFHINPLKLHESRVLYKFIKSQRFLLTDVNINFACTRIHTHTYTYPGKSFRYFLFYEFYFNCSSITLLAVFIHNKNKI